MFRAAQNKNFMKGRFGMWFLKKTNQVLNRSFLTHFVKLLALTAMAVSSENYDSRKM